MTKPKFINHIIPGSELRCLAKKKRTTMSSPAPYADKAKARFARIAEALPNPAHLRTLAKSLADDTECPGKCCEWADPRILEVWADRLDDIWRELIAELPELDGRQHKELPREHKQERIGDEEDKS